MLVSPFLQWQSQKAKAILSHDLDLYYIPSFCVHNGLSLDLPLFTLPYHCSFDIRNYLLECYKLFPAKVCSVPEMTLTCTNSHFDHILTLLVLCCLPTAPAVSARHMQVNGSTQYDDEFNESDGRGPQPVRDMAKALGAQSLQNYIHTTKGKGKLENIPPVSHHIEPAHLHFCHFFVCPISLALFAQLAWLAEITILKHFKMYIWNGHKVNHCTPMRPISRG